MFRKMNSNQKIYACTVQPVWTELKCANIPCTGIDYYPSLSEVRYAAVTTFISIDTSPEPFPHEELYHYSDTSAIKTV